MPNHNFLTCAKAEIKDLTVCIVVNGEKFQSSSMTSNLIGLTWMRQCTMSNSSELFAISDNIFSSFKLTDPLFLGYTNTQTYRQLDIQADGHEYIIVVVDKPQLY